MPHQCTACGRTFPDGSKEMLSGCPDCGGNKFQFRPDGAAAADSDAPDPDASPPDPPEADARGSTVAGAVSEATDRVRDLVSSGDSNPLEDDPDAAVDAPESLGADRPGTDPSGVAESPGEDAAQANARSDVVDPADLPAADDAGVPNEGVDSIGSPGADPDNSRSSKVESGSAGTGDRTPSDSIDEASDGPREDDSSGKTAGGASPFTGSGDREEGPDLDELRAELNEQFESIRIVEPGQYELNLMELYDRDEYIISLMEDGRYAIEVPEAWRGEE